MEYEYKNITINLLFSSTKKINEKVQTYLDKYAKAGWRLHSINVYGAFASVGHIVFEREVKDN